MRREQGEGSSYGQSRIMAKPRGCVWLGKCDAGQRESPPRHKGPLTSVPVLDP